MEEKEIQELKEKVAQQDQLIKLLLTQVGSNANATLAQAHTTGRFDDVSIVHLYDYPEGLGTHIALTNLTIDLSKFGEERMLSMQQFEELVGRYRTLFTEGYIALADQYKDLAKRYGIKTEKDYKLTREMVEDFSKLDIPTLTAVFNDSPFAHKQLIAETWKRKLIEKDPKYMDLNIVSILNSLTDGGFQYDLNELMNVYNKNKKKK